jgi:hypothetical protein
MPAMIAMLRCGFAVIAAASLTGCLDIAERCGDATPAGACLSVISVVPSTNLVPTSNVDVVQGKCGDASEPLKQTDEPFRDHDVEVTLRNDGPLSIHDPVTYGPAVVVDRFEVTFQLNTVCSSCPQLDPLHGLGPTITVLGGEQQTFSLPLFPIHTKQEYLDKGGDAYEFPSYSASYKLHGRDPEGDVVIEGAATFTVGNFQNCEL